MGLGYVVLPGINEIPQQALPSLVNAVGDADVTFPPTVPWSFRVASPGLQAVIWTTVALLFGALAQRQLDGAGRSVSEISPFVSALSTVVA